MLCIDENITDKLINDLRDSVLSTGMRRVVLGLSGGVDSALALSLAVKALGRDSVFPYYMPYKSSSEKSRLDAVLMAEFEGTALTEADITPMAEAYQKNNSVDAYRLGNILARLRMIVLFDKSVEKHALVLGTGNKSEILLGYMTWHGDSAYSLNPLGDMYKTQVYEASRIIGVPESIINKAPSADLIPGQTDESDYGYPYKEIDKLLYFLIEEDKTPDDAVTAGFAEHFVADIAARISRFEFKRRPPKILSIGQNKI